MDKSCEGHGVATPSVHQTLEEVGFERGIWNFALYGDIEKIKEKLDKGTDPSVRDSSGYTALHYAARNGKFGACEYLLQKGADVNAQTHGGATPLHRASLQGHKDVVNLLLKYKADPGICDSDGKSSLHKAAEGKHMEIAKILVGLKPELKLLNDNRGHAPFFYADSENFELVDVLSN